MKRTFFLLAIGVSLFSPPAYAETPPVDHNAIQRSFDMLEIEMKMKVLEKFYERVNEYVPAQWMEQYQADYQRLSMEAGMAGMRKMNDMERWTEEIRKDETNELYVLYKSAEAYVTNLVASEISELEDDQEYLDAQQELYKRKKNKLEIARYVEGLTEKVHKANISTDMDHHYGQMADRWRAAARKSYRESAQYSDNLLRDITRYERERLDVQTELAFLKGFQEKLEIVQQAQEPVDTAMEKIEEAAVKKAQAYLSSRYEDVGEDFAEKSWGKIKEEHKALKGIYDNVSALDQDVDLGDNPTALRSAKGFTLLAGIYNYTLGKVKDKPFMKAFGPMVDFLSFYGDSLNLIPEVAQRMQRTVNRIDQGYRNVRLLDGWNVVPEGDLREITVMKEFGLRVAIHGTYDDDYAENGRFYMLVPSNVVTRGYATFTGTQFKQMIRILADERFLFAREDVSGDILDVLSYEVDKEYLDALSGESRKTKLTAEDLYYMTVSRSPITYNDKSWTADTFRSECESEVERLAVYMTLNTALYAPTDDSKTKWYAYKNLLLESGVALNPQQILKTFSFYHNGPENEKMFKAYLDQIQATWKLKQRGIATGGVPLIKKSDGSPKTGKVSLESDIVIGELAPGIQIPAQIEWKLPPAFVHDEKTEITRLVNGIQKTTCIVNLPPGHSIDELEHTRVVVSIPDETHEEITEEALAPTAEFSDVPPQAVRKLIGQPIGFSMQYDPMTPKLNLKYEDEYYGFRPQYVTITLPQVDSIPFWDLLRARDPDGPWTMVERNVYDKSRVINDKFPLLFPGVHTWYYAAIAKSRQQTGPRHPNPDYSRAATITLDLSIGTPRLSANVLRDRDADRLRMTEEERQHDDTRQREEKAKRAERIRDAEDNYGNAPSPEQRQLMREEIADIQKRQADEDWAEERYLVLNWDAPDVSEPFAKSTEIKINIFRASQSTGPYHLIDQVEANRGFFREDGNVLPGHTYFYKARFVAKTGGACIYSDWAKTQGVVPKKRIIGPSTSLRNQIRVAKGQKARVAIVETEYKTNDRADPVDRSNLLLPSTPPGAVIVRFDSDGENHDIIYFPLRESGGDYTVTQDGLLSIWFNNTKSGSLRRQLKRLRATVEVFPGAIAPEKVVLNPPSFKRNVQDGFTEYTWRYEQSASGLTKENRHRVELYSAPSATGPWYPLFQNTPPEPPLLYEAYQLLPYLQTWLCTKQTVAREEVWSAPMKVELKPVTAKVGPKHADVLIAGRRGQKITIDVTGNWAPFSYEGLGEYGPEGVSPKRFGKLVDQLEAIEKGQPADSVTSGGLLELTMDGPGANRSRSSENRVLKDVDYHLRRKNSFLEYDLPAGCLICRYRETGNAQYAFEQYYPFSRSGALFAHEFALPRQWSFVFPEDGELWLTPNYCHGWTGSMQFIGHGELILNITMSDPSTTSGSADDFDPRELPEPEWWRQESNRPAQPEPIEEETPPSQSGPNLSPSTVSQSLPQSSSTPTARGVSPEPRRPAASTSRGENEAPPADPSSETEPQIRPALSGEAAPPSSTLPGEIAPANPSSVEGRNLFHAGNFQQAATAFAKAIQENPDNPDHRYDLGNTYWHMGQLQLAEEQFRAALQTNPAHAPSALSLGRLLSSQNRYAEALNYCVQAAKAFPKDATVWNDLGNSQFGVQQYTQAAESYFRAIQSNPSDSQLYRNLGVTQQYINQWPAAEQSYRQAVRLAPQNHVFLNEFADLLFKLQRWQESAQIYAQAINLDPNNGLYRANYAGALVYLQNFDEARRQAQFARQLGFNTHWVFEML